MLFERDNSLKKKQHQHCAVDQFTFLIICFVNVKFVDPMKTVDNGCVVINFLVLSESNMS